MICPCPVGLFPAVRMLTALLLFAAVSAHAQATDRHPRPPRAEAVENRHNHGHDYPHRGAGYRPYFHQGRPLYYYDGVWYARVAVGSSSYVPPSGCTFLYSRPSQHRVVGRSSLSLRRRYRLPLGSRDRCLFGRATPARRGSIGRRGARGPAESVGDRFFACPNDGQTSEQQSADVTSATRGLRIRPASTRRSLAVE